MKYFYYVFVICESGKSCAYVERVHENTNLISLISSVKNLSTAHQCHTRKQAQEISDFWNECHKNNGTYMYA